LLAFGQYGPESKGFGMPNGIAVSPEGKLWMADAGNNRIEQFTSVLP